MSAEREKKVEAMALACDFLFVEDLLRLACVAKVFQKPSVSYLSIREYDEDKCLWSIQDLATRFPQAQHLTITEICKVDGRAFCEHVRENFISVSLKGASTNTLKIYENKKERNGSLRRILISENADERIRNFPDFLLDYLNSGSVKHIQISSREDFAKVVTTYKGLETLSLQCCRNLDCKEMLSLKSLEMFGRGQPVYSLGVPPQLEELQMKGMEYPLVPILSAIRDCSGSLRRLSLERITYDVRDHRVEFILERLESLELTKSPDLKVITVVAPRCRAVCLDDCVDLETLTVDSHVLEELPLGTLLSLKRLHLRKPYPPGLEEVSSMWPDMVLTSIE